jgi:hypothetical protein
MSLLGTLACNRWTSGRRRGFVTMANPAATMLGTEKPPLAKVADHGTAPERRGGVEMLRVTG